MSTPTKADIEKIADLSKLQFSSEKIDSFSHSLGDILTLVNKMDALDTKNVEPLAHPLNVTQPLRADIVSEHNQREAFQAHAPNVVSGLYIVPKFVESE